MRLGFSTVGAFVKRRTDHYQLSVDAPRIVCFLCRACCLYHHYPLQTQKGSGKRESESVIYQKS